MNPYFLKSCLLNFYNYYFPCYNKKKVYVLYAKNSHINFHDDKNNLIDFYSNFTNWKFTNWKFTGPNKSIMPEIDCDGNTYIWNTKYPEYILYTGPSTELDEFIEYLNSYYSELCEETKIIRFMIQSNSTPIDINDIDILCCQKMQR